MRELVLSASSVNSYLECPLQWYFTHILGERGETSLKKTIGIAVHDSIEILLKHLINLPASGPALDPEAVYHAAFDAELALGPVRLAKDDVSVEAGRQSGLKALTAYMAQLVEVDDVLAIAHVELDFEITVNDIPYSGTIDRVDVDAAGGESSVLLRDTKITHSRPQKGKYRLNMTGYGLGLEQETGLRPTLLVLDYIVRTKEPYYWPEYIDPPSELDIGEFAATLARVAEGIEASRFPALGLTAPFSCSACPHQQSCGPYQRMQEKLG